MSYIPNGNAAFDAWQDNFVAVAAVHVGGTDWGLPTAATAEWALLTTTATKKKKRWDAIWAIVSTKVFTHPQEVEMKKARQDYESGDKKNPADTSLRLFIARYIRNNPLVTDEQKKEMGLTVPDTVKTPTSELKSMGHGADLSGRIKRAEHLMQLSEVTTVGQKSKARGEGVQDIEVYITFTEAKVAADPDIKTFVFDGVVKRGNYYRVFDTTHEYMRAWYYARKVFKGKVKTYGPPSPVWSGVIL